MPGVRQPAEGDITPFDVGGDAGLWVDYWMGYHCYRCGVGEHDRGAVCIYSAGRSPALNDRILDALCCTCAVAELRRYLYLRHQ